MSPDARRHSRSLLRCALPFSALLVACSSKNEADTSGGDTTVDASSDSYDLVTSEFTLPAGDERSLCYATTLESDLTVDRFDYAPQELVHHFLLAKTLSPEPEGLHECDVLFRFSWIPLFGAGNGESHLELPDGSAQVLPAGTQLLVQLHLLNATGAEMTDRAHITMRRTDIANPKPVGIYAFGTDRIALPSGQSDVVDTCVMPESVELFAILPHMHYLGRSLSFQTGPTADQLTEVYRRDPWTFDDQYVDDFPRLLEAGTTTRTTCSYDNTETTNVVFGESSHDEMCFLVGFAVDRDTLGGCLTFGGGPVDAGAGDGAP